MNDAAAVARSLLAGGPVLERSLLLELDGINVAIRSNSAELLDVLERYFAHVAGDGDAGIEIVAIESPPVDAGVDFADWTREPGKSGRKDAFAELADGRLIRKVRTGMVFLQSERHRVAAGPCLRYPNQVINFVNAQYMNRLQQGGALICHAAAVTRGERALALAGFSGGGKSTLMLKLLPEADVAFLTNDRLFLERRGEEIRATGIPKLPRVNPGTVVHDEHLRDMLAPADRDAYLALPAAELWELEGKHDVDVIERYGPGKIAAAAPLAGVVILNWRRDGAGPTRFEPVALDRRDDLLGAVMKSPGPFYQRSDGSLLADGETQDAAPYRALLAGIPAFEVTGTVDFAQAARHCLDILPG